MKHWYHSWLVPYAEGTLDERRRAKLEARLAHDPALVAEAEAVRRTAQRLGEAAQDERGQAGEAATPSVSELWPGIEARLRPTRRVEARPWLWAGGLCAVTSLAWATLWGPLTPHTANSTQGAKMAQTAPEVLPSPGATPAKMRMGGQPRKPKHNLGRPVKRRGRVKRAAPVPRPTPADLLASRTAPAPTGANSPDASDAAPSGPGHFRLATGVHDLPGGASDQGDQNGTTDKPDATSAPSDGPAKTGAASSRPGRRQRRHRHHRQRQSADKPAPALPPDTVPQTDDGPKISKHRPDID